MAFYRATFEGVVEGDYESAEEAKRDLVAFVTGDQTDAYGRSWEDLVVVEEYDMEKGGWVPR